MAKITILFCAVILLGGGFVLAQQKEEYILPDTAPYKKPQQQPVAKPDDGQSRFEELKKALPKILADWTATVLLEEPKIRIARRTSSKEAKFTFISKARNDTTFIITLYLKYYDSAWTVLRWECGSSSWSATTQEFLNFYVQKLAITIDEFDGKKSEQAQPSFFRFR